MYKIIIILFLSLSILKQINCSVKVPEVDTNLGKVIGFNAKFEDHTLDVFYGIPYGKPPVNERRFRNTTLVEKFEQNPYYATKFTSHCPIKVSIL